MNNSYLSITHYPSSFEVLYLNKSELNKEVSNGVLKSKETNSFCTYKSEWIYTNKYGLDKLNTLLLIRYCHWITNYIYPWIIINTEMKYFK